MQSRANDEARMSTQTAANASELSADEILILRDTDETAGAVAHLAAARLYALMTSDAEEPGIETCWFDWRGEFATGPSTPEDGRAAAAKLQSRITAMACYVRTRNVEKPEQLHRHAGGRNWDGASIAYQQALDLFRVTAISVATSMEHRRAALGEVERQIVAAKAHQPLRLEDSIFEPEESMGTMLPHAVQALKDGAKAMLAAIARKGDAQDQNGPMSVGEPPAGHAKAKAQTGGKSHKSKKQG